MVFAAAMFLFLGTQFAPLAKETYNPPGIACELPTERASTAALHAAYERGRHEAINEASFAAFASFVPSDDEACFVGDQPPRSGAREHFPTADDLTCFDPSL
jgi:hypothetical protein